MATALARLRTPWIVSYDNALPIRQLYRPYEHVEFGLYYSTQARYQGSEVMFFPPA